MPDTSAYVDVMTLWARAAERRGMTHEQTAILAAQFVGVVVSNAGLSVEGQRQVLEVCARAMSTACAGKALRQAS